MSRVKLPYAVPPLVLSGVCLIAFGCGGLSPSKPPPPTSPQASVGTLSISPNRTVLSAGETPRTTQQFAASVSGTPDAAVTWTVSGTGCSGTGCGTISSSGLYTAPVAVPPSANVTITATSVSNSAQSASAQVTIVPPQAAGYTLVWEDTF